MTKESSVERCRLRIEAAARVGLQLLCLPQPLFILPGCKYHHQQIHPIYRCHNQTLASLTMSALYRATLALPNIDQVQRSTLTLTKPSPTSWRVAKKPSTSQSSAEAYQVTRRSKIICRLPSKGVFEDGYSLLLLTLRKPLRLSSIEECLWAEV